MNASTAHLNLLLAWLWILLGFVSGLFLGMFFHRENWLGGYGSFRRRLYRLAHISFFGLGAVNLLFWLTLHDGLIGGGWVPVASWAFIAGALTMPVCCVVLAQFPRAQLIFSVPVLCLLTGGLITVLLLAGQTAAPAASPSSTPNPNLETRGQ